MDKDSHSTDLSISGEEGQSTRTKLFSNALVTLVTCLPSLNKGVTLPYLTLFYLTPKNCIKMLRNLAFVVQCTYFSIRPKKGFVFLEQLLSNFRYKKQLLIVFEQLLGNFLRNYGKLFGKSRATCGKPCS